MIAVLNRRLASTAGVLIGLLVCTAGAQAAENLVGSPLPPWAPGTLDIHQIATGRGNSALIVGPDGTSIMIDAGASAEALDVSCPPRPNASRRPGEWIARYALRHLRPTGRAQLDYFVATHLHPDHVGDVGSGTPPSRQGGYLLTGVTDVAEIIPIGTVIDRGFPDYNYPSRWQTGFASSYFAFIAARTKSGGASEKIRVGAADQLRLRHAPAQFPSFVVRNIAANGSVWTGTGNDARSLVPPLGTLPPADYPDENSCSIALRVSYGKFDYYTGGDLACSTRDGEQPWRDMETPVAKITGAVEVAVANHHAYFDAVGPEAVRALQPLVWVVPVWHITHLNIAQLENMQSERLYSGPREILVTDLMPATALIDRRFLPKVKSTSGHIVVRVAPGGAEFRVFVTDNSDENDTVTAALGPYYCR